MQIQLDELLKGKAYQRGSSLYPATEKLVAPFISAVEDYVDTWNIEVQKPSELAVEQTVRPDETEEVEEYSIYSRVLVEGILKDEYQINIGESDNYKKTIGFLYGLDVQSPVCKAYSGFLRRVCLNMNIFGTDKIVTKNFSAADFDQIYEAPSKFLGQLESEKQEFIQTIEMLNNTTYQGESLQRILGQLAVKCISKNPGMGTAYTNLVKFVSSSQDSNGVKNVYFKRDGVYTPFDLYQALTGTLSQKADLTKKADLIVKTASFFLN